MIQKYKKKPVVIEAVQFFPFEFCLRELAEWGLNVELDTSNKNLPILHIPTLEGDMIAKGGDYIIKGVKGEFYPCRADIFWETYARVELSENPSEVDKLPENKEDLLKRFARYGFRDEYGHDLTFCDEFLHLVDAYCAIKGKQCH